jgi:hypothetical protein
MSNNDNLTTIIENEITNIFDNILNYNGSSPELPRNTEDYLHDQTIPDIHTLQMNTLNNFINQYFSQINTFQENSRDIIQTLRTTIHQQNVAYSHLLRTHNMSQNTTRTNTRNRTNANTTWNVPQYEFSYEIPQVNVPRRQFANRVSQQQMNAAVETVQYNEDMAEERCPITLENFIVGENICRIRHCRHIFKPTGLMLWFQRNVRCPVCRYDIRTYHSRTETTASELPEPTRSSNQILEDISGNLVNTRNIIYDRINNVMRELQNHLPENDVPTLYTIDIPIYIDDFSYNRIRNYA